MRHICSLSLSSAILNEPITFTRNIALSDCYSTRSAPTYYMHRPYLLTLAVMLAATCSSFGATTVACSNQLTDASAIQSAVNAGGTITLVGVCNIGSTSILIGTGTTIQGSGAHAQLYESTDTARQFPYGANSNTVVHYSGGADAFASSGDNNVISGLTIVGPGSNGVGVHLTKNDISGLTGQVGWTISNNEIYNFGDGVRIEHVIGRGSSSETHSYIANNYFHNLSEWGIYWGSGIDETTIDCNFFTLINANPIKGFNDWFNGQYNPYTAHHVSITNNDMQQYSRIAIENQGESNSVYSCPTNSSGGTGECQGGNHWIVGAEISGNIAHNLIMSFNTWCYSNFWGDATLLINNTCINAQTGGTTALNQANEWAGFDKSVFQGNVVKSKLLSQTVNSNGYARGFNPPVTTGYTSLPLASATGACLLSTCTITYQNNVWENDQNPNSDYNHGEQDVNWDQAKYVTQYDYSDDSPATLNNVSETSALQVGSISVSANTFSTYVISNLAVRWVKTYVDGTLVNTQKLQDVNANFSSDQKWQYHTTINPSTYSSGSHTLTMTATDAKGTTQSQSVSFGGSGSSEPALIYSLSAVPTGGATVPPNPSLQPAAITIASWVNGSSTQSAIPPFVSYGIDVSTSHSYVTGAASIDGNHSADFYFLTGSGTVTHISGTTKLVPATWYFVVGTYDGVRAELYVNGNLEGSASVPGAIYYPASISGIEVARQVSSTAANGLTGVESGVQIFNGAEPASWVSSAYAAGPPPSLPAVPTGLTAMASSNAEIDLAWTAAAPGITYDIFRAPTCGALTSPNVQPIATNVTAYAYRDTALTATTSYCYEVTALNTSGTSPPSAQVSATTKVLQTSPPNVVATYATPVTNPAPTVTNSIKPSANPVVVSSTSSAGTPVAPAPDVAPTVTNSIKPSASPVLASSTTSAGTAVAPAPDAAPTVTNSIKPSANPVLVSSTTSAGTAVAPAPDAAPVFQQLLYPIGYAIPANTVLQPATSFTLTAWIECTTPMTNYPVFISYGQDLVAPYETYVLQAKSCDGNNPLDLYLTTSNGTANQQPQVYGSTHLQAATPYFIAATWDGATARLYVNGVLDGAAPVAGTLSYPTTGMYGLAIGTKYLVDTNRFYGMEEDARVYTVALPQSQLETMYSAGPAMLSIAPAECGSPGFGGGCATSEQ